MVRSNLLLFFASPENEIKTLKAFDLILLQMFQLSYFCYHIKTNFRNQLLVILAVFPKKVF